MNTVFGTNYAKAYDDIYQEKDYQKECGMLRRIFEKHSDLAVKTVLDLGCGTGNHDLILAEMGYTVDGADRSNDMIEIARKKAAARQLPINYHCADIRNLELGKKFDATLMMFAVVGYQLENQDVIDALSTAREHLNEGGLLVMDLWYGPAVLKQRPSDKVKVITTPDATILRTSSGMLDINRQICTVSFNLWKFSGDRLLSETREEHSMRFFFKQELELLLDQSGFKLATIGEFPDYDRVPTEDTWNVVVIAKAVKR